MENDKTGISEDLLSAIRREAANSSLKGIRESIDRARSVVASGRAFLSEITPRRLMEAIPAVYNDYIWTLNLVHIESICESLAYAVRKVEKRSERAFGGFYPAGNESGLWTAGDYKIGHVLGEREFMLVIGFFVIPGEDRRLVYLEAEVSAQFRLGPFGPLYRDPRAVLLPSPFLMEPSSMLNVKTKYVEEGNEGEICVEEDGGSAIHVLGYRIRW
jgi:hypothetical protein